VVVLGTGWCSLTGSAGKDSKVLTLASPVNTELITIARSDKRILYKELYSTLS